MADAAKTGYKRLAVYWLAHDLAVRIHTMTLILPFLERFEESPQIRRSSKRVAASIVEGYGLRKYKDDFLRYLHRALASAEETREHLSMLHDTGSLGDRNDYASLDNSCRRLCASLALFIKGVERDHSKPFYLGAGGRPGHSPLR